MRELPEACGEPHLMARKPRPRPASTIEIPLSSGGGRSSRGERAARPQQGGEQPLNQKYSVLVPHDIDSRVMQVATHQRLSLSDAIRLILDTGSRAVLGGVTVEEGKLQIEVNDPTRAALESAARALNLSPAAVVQMMLARHLPALVEEARAVDSRLQQALTSSHNDGVGRKDNGNSKPHEACKPGTELS